MVTDLKRTIIYICRVCGKIKKFDINIFDFSGGKILYLKCGCGNAYLRLSCSKNGKYIITAPCAMCNEEHIFEIGRKTFWNAPQIVFGCPNADFELFYCGESSENDVICSDKSEYLPTGNYFFENPFLSDVLNEISICEKKKKIICDCGSDKICKNLFFDRVELLCRKCGSKTVVDATGENDVKRVIKAAKSGGIKIISASNGEKK